MINSEHKFDDGSRGYVYDDFNWVLHLPTDCNLKGEASSQEEAEQAIANAHHRYEVCMGFKKEKQAT